MERNVKYLIPETKQLVPTQSGSYQLSQPLRHGTPNMTWIIARIACMPLNVHVASLSQWHINCFPLAPAISDSAQVQAIHHFHVLS